MQFDIHIWLKSEKVSHPEDAGVNRRLLECNKTICRTLIRRMHLNSRGQIVSQRARA